VNSETYAVAFPCTLEIVNLETVTPFGRKIIIAKYYKTCPLIITDQLLQCKLAGYKLLSVANVVPLNQYVGTYT
jgi:hypothetical protein